MIKTLSSGNLKDDYILDCLWDIGLRTFSNLSEDSSETSGSNLLLVTKEDMTDEDIDRVIDFASNVGDVIVLGPCSSLFDNFGGWKSKEGSSSLIPSDYYQSPLGCLPIFEPIQTTDRSEIILSTTKKGFPFLVQIRAENTIEFFSFSVSRNVFKIRQGTYGNGYLRKRGELGGFAHREFNPLEMVDGTILDLPCADIFTAVVLQRILRSLAGMGICLPLLWTIPEGKDASVIMTMDEDWASPAVTRDALDIFIDDFVPLTLFLTTPFAEQDKLPDDDLIEYSIHPYHEDDVFSTATMKDYMRFIPQPPTGFRNHRRLVQKPEMYECAEELGLRWSSNLGVSKSTGYSLGTGFPMKMTYDNTRTDILEFPINFEDDVFFTTCREEGFDGAGIISLLRKAMDLFHTYFVFAFHPIHVFLNSRSPEEYQKVKRIGVTNEESGLMALRKPLLKNEGTRSLLRRIIGFIRSSRHRLHIGTLGEIDEFWRRRERISIVIENDSFRISPVYRDIAILLPCAEKGGVGRELRLCISKEVDFFGIRCLLVRPPQKALTRCSWSIPSRLKPKP